MNKTIISSAIALIAVVAVFGISTRQADAAVIAGCPSYSVYYYNGFYNNYCVPSSTQAPGYYTGYNNYNNNGYYGGGSYYPTYPTQPYQYNQPFYPYNNSASFFYPNQYTTPYYNGSYNGYNNGYNNYGNYGGWYY